MDFALFVGAAKQQQAAVQAKEHGEKIAERARKANRKREKCFDV